ncbi:MAG TPA: biotin transporter BioY, partial [Rhodospirillales bacterium]|nr:biotin transporter BioY [Rhodospirillales bacterium]
LYLLEGIYGLPVFAGTPERGLGLAYLLGPTGGYLVGFLLAAGIAGWAAERRMSTVALLLALLVATAAIYLPGVAWLARFVGLDDAIAFGAAPFLLGDLVKLLLVLAVARLAFARPAGSAVDRSA